MSKHTLGPWESNPCSVKDCYDIENDYGLLIAEVYDEHYARLIAQAPRLLEALRRLVNNNSHFEGRENIEYWESEESCGRGGAEDMLFALEVIAAATGDSHE